MEMHVDAWGWNLMDYRERYWEKLVDGSNTCIFTGIVGIFVKTHQSAHIHYIICKSYLNKTDCK